MTNVLETGFDYLTDFFFRISYFNNGLFIFGYICMSQRYDVLHLSFWEKYRSVQKDVNTKSK